MEFMLVEDIYAKTEIAINISAITQFYPEGEGTIIGINDDRFFSPIHFMSLFRSFNDLDREEEGND